MAMADFLTANYFPVINAAMIRDELYQLVFHTHQSIGATSIAPGGFEFMLHRRPMRDDGQGLEEGMNDTAWHEVG